MDIHRVVIAPYAARQMFALADDIHSYPLFLPWCERAEVRRDGEQVRADLHINYHGLRVSFATRNRHVAPECIDIALESGPLSSLSGEWRFADLDEERCRVEFHLQYAFKNRLMAAVFAKLFARFFAHFMDSFIARAERVYGRGMPVEVVCATDGGRRCSLSLPSEATMGDALAACGFWTGQKAGLFGKICPPTQKLRAGDRVEIYQPLKNDPREARRRRAARK